MTLNDMWLPYIKPTQALKKIMPDDYINQMVELYKIFKKDPENFISEIGERQISHTNTELFHLSLPRRKRFLGNVPLGLEIALFNTPAEFQYRIIERLALTDSAISNISHDLTALPDVKTFLESVYEHAPLSGTNLGIYAHAFFHNRFEMVGAPIFSLDDNLYRELCETDISKKTPCEFFRTPMPTLYLEFGQNRDPELPLCYHQQSGWHCIEGAYLNTFILTAEELLYECENPDIALADVSIERNKHNVISHALASGFIHKDGGEVQVTEVLVTGSPLGKEHILDDSTHQFVLVVQDREMDVETMLDWHLRYNKKELSSQVNVKNSGGTDHLKLQHSHQISEHEVITISNTVHAITKALLYINSESCHLTNIKEATEQRKAIARTQNKAKIRKLKNRGRALSDYILITLPKDIEDEVIQSQGKNKGSKSTHWRRAHFHTFRYGEGRSKSRVKWIPRKLVNATKGLVKNKEYKIK